MPLIIEDGSIVAGANSYVTLEEVRNYSLVRGVALSDDDSVLTQLLIKATDYLETKAPYYQGFMVSPTTQELQWPRKAVQLYGVDYPFTSIPRQLKQAQCVLVIELTNGLDLLPTSTGPFVKEETVGPITTKYSETVGVTTKPEVPAVEALLLPLFNATGEGYTLSVVRL